MIRLIAVDMDGTLLNNDHLVTPRTEDAVRKVMECGAYFCLASGRMPEAMIGFARQLRVNCPMILFNGAMVADPVTGTIYKKAPIPAERAKEIADRAERLGIYLQAYPGEGYYCAYRSKHTESYENHIKVPCRELGQSLSKGLNSDMVKMLAIGSEAQMDEAKLLLSEAFPDVCFAKSKPTYLEIFSREADKGRSLSFLANMLGVRQEETMAFGDGQNDLPMIDWAGTGCIMDNASEEVKRHADCIAPDNHSDGLAIMLNEYMKKGLIGGTANGQRK